MRKAIIAGIIVCGAVLVLLAPEVAVFGPERFERGNGKPVLVTREFSSPITGNDLKLRIVNGDEHGDNRVTAGRVTLNGLEVVSPNDFKKKVVAIERLVNIGESNVLTVILEGKPGSLMTLGIYGFAPEPQASIAVVPGTVWSWETGRLTWTSQFADKVMIEPGLGEVALNGSLAVQPGETTTYNLTASGLGGSVSASATLTVLQDETLPTVTISEPQTGASYRSLPVNVSATFSDGESGLDPESIAVTLNGTDITDSLGVVGYLPGNESGDSFFSESGRLGGAVSAEECGDSCFRFTVQQLTDRAARLTKMSNSLRSDTDIFPPKAGERSSRRVGTELPP